MFRLVYNNLYFNGNLYTGKISISFQLNYMSLFFHKEYKGSFLPDIYLPIAVLSSIFII